MDIIEKNEQVNEKIFLKYILENNKYFSVVKSSVFTNDYVKKLYSICKKFYEKFLTSPSKDQISMLIWENHLKDFPDLTNKEDVEKLLNSCIDEVQLPEYDQSWLKSSFESWLKFRTLNDSIFDLISYLKTTNINTENIDKVVNSSIDILQKKNNFSILDFDGGKDVFNPLDHTVQEFEYFTTGYKWLDEQLNGGFQKKQLVVFAGGPKAGKSQFLANIAVQSCINGHNTLVISCEMSESTYLKRISSNLFSIPYNEYETFIKDKKNLSEIIEKTRKKNKSGLIVPGLFRIKEFPTSTASTVDIENYIDMIEKTYDCKINIVIIDYLNILKNWRNPNTENMYMKIKQIAEDIRAVAQRKDVCIVSATQLNRAGTDAYSIRKTDISESMGLVQTVDALFGIPARDVTDIQNNWISLQQVAIRNGVEDETPHRFKFDTTYLRISEMDEDESKFTLKKENNEQIEETKNIWDF